MGTVDEATVAGGAAEVKRPAPPRLEPLRNRPRRLPGHRPAGIPDFGAGGSCTVPPHKSPLSGAAAPLMQHLVGFRAGDRTSSAPSPPSCSEAL